MRRRLMAAWLGVLAAALLAFALPLGVAVRGVLLERGLDELEAVAQQAAVFIDERARTCDDVRLLLAVAGEDRSAQLSIFDRGGALLAAERGFAPTVGSELTAATRGRVGRSVAAGRLAVATPVSSTVCGPRLVLHAERPLDAVQASVRSAWLAIAAVGVTVLALASVGAWLTGRWLTAPLEDLARSARRLGEGDFTERAPRSGLPEPDAIAAALDVTADRLGRALERSRAFAADASHQLRTPLTAARLNLEAAPPGPEVEAVAAEIDRLEATIDELARLTAPEESERDLDLAALVRARADAWMAAARDRGRRLRVELLPAPAVRARPAAVSQALQVLVDNALEHGRGSVVVRVDPLPGRAGRPAVRVAVVDEGDGFGDRAVLPTDASDRGGGPLPVHGGRGLWLARSLIQAEGGRLVLEDRAPGAWACLVIPSVPGGGATNQAF